MNWREPARLAGFALAAGVVYEILLGYRPDYPGHFLAGFGATAVLLAIARRVPDPNGWRDVLVLVTAVAVGVLCEFTVFHVVITDPVDITNQSLGAALAAACVIGRPTSDYALVAVGFPALVAGFFFVYA